MNDKELRILNKVLEYANEVFSYVDGITYDMFLTDRKTISATAFMLGQIGELAKSLSDDTMLRISQVNWSGVKGLRNRIFHDYEKIDMKMLWNVIDAYLPELTEQIDNYLNSV